MRKVIALGLTTMLSLAVAPRAEAFCGFYVAPSDAPLYADATMVSLMREGTRTALSMSNNYKGPAADFAMVVPVPVVLQKESVKTLKHDVFQKLEQLTAPRLVEYWEQDPCPLEAEEQRDSKEGGKGIARKMEAPAAAAPGGYGVKIEAQFAVGEYEVVILSAEESDGLERWLRDNKYNIPKGASEALAPYVKEQMKFFVAKVDIKKVKLDDKGVAVLSPIRVHYESPDFRLPVRLGLLNSSGKQDLIVWVLSRTSRYELANYPNAFIPTNVDVTNDTRNAFGPFYAALFDATVEKSGGRAIVTEYAWTSSGCDPCPTPPLTDVEVSALGGDALLGMAAPVDAPAPGAMGQPGMYFGGTSKPVVITRLHARYDSKTLSDDLVFQTAEPVVGGREFLTVTAKNDPKNKGVELEKGAKKSGFNQFQARYAIRHAWEGPITCANPRRGVWGGPPNHQKPAPVAATNLAAAPRGQVQLASYAVSPIEELDVKKDGKPAGSAPNGELAPHHGPHGSPATLYRTASSPPQYGWFLVGFVGAGLFLGVIAYATRRR